VCTVDLTCLIPWPATWLLHRHPALLTNVADSLVRAWMARLVANTVSEAFLNWLDIGDPDRDDEMVERVAYLLAGMVGSLWHRAQAHGERVGPADQPT
jgi:hypothetical protein